MSDGWGVNMRVGRQDHGVFLALLIAYALYAAYFFPFISDDALISLRYSQRFLEGQGLTWTDGIRVEGYTNLSWVLLCAALGRLGLDLVDASRILGVAFTLVGAMAILLIRHPAGDEASRWTRRVAMAAYLLNTTTVVWSIGGLEQPVVAACMAWALCGSLGLMTSAQPRVVDALIPALSLSLMCLTRPDSPLLVVALAGAVLLARRVHGKSMPLEAVALLVLLPAAVYVAQTLFRHHYYGEWVANTALVKARPSVHHALHGMRYLAKGIAAMPVLALGAVCAGWFFARRKQWAHLILLLACTLPWAVYLVVIGGDIFPAFRHFTPLVVGMALLMGLAAGEALASRPPLLGYGLIALLAASLVATQSQSKSVMGAKYERWEWACKDLSETLKAGFGGAQPLMAVTAAGCLPYWTGFPALDMLGLNDHYLPRHPPKDFGQGPLAHELGSGPYVMSRAPDLIIYHLGLLRDEFRTGKELDQMPEFKRQYTPITLIYKHQGERKALVWLRKLGGKLGLKATDRGLRIPGYLANGNPASVASLNANHQWVTRIPPGQAAWLLVPPELVPSSPFDLLVDAQGAVQASSQRLPSGDLEVRVQNTSMGVVQLKEIELRGRPPHAAAQRPVRPTLAVKMPARESTLRARS
jgi:arabinofuranosyltransferase